MFHGPTVRTESASQIAELAFSFFFQLHCEVHTSKDISTEEYVLTDPSSNSKLDQSIIHH